MYCAAYQLTKTIISLMLNLMSKVIENMKIKLRRGTDIKIYIYKKKDEIKNKLGELYLPTVLTMVVALVTTVWKHF